MHPKLRIFLQLVAALLMLAVFIYGAHFGYIRSVALDYPWFARIVLPVVAGYAFAVGAILFVLVITIFGFGVIHVGKLLIQLFRK